MMPVDLYYSAFAVCMLVTLLGRIGVRMSSAGEETVRFWPACFFALAGGMSAAALLIKDGGAGITSLPGFLISVSFASTLCLAAFVDRETSWAPDILMAILAAGAVVLASRFHGWDLSLMSAAAAGAGGLLAVNLLWMAAVRLTGWIWILPPGDILGISIPFILFGATPYSIGIMFGTAALLVLCRSFDWVHAVFEKPGNGEKVARDMDVDIADVRKSIPFLSVCLPVVWAALLIYFW
ncbi:hypothetical protein [Leisingera caerulea]|uniref:hypothetical protein n=1 Tax=Leisingera caerulea TaxID=506591 RepID=UPI0003F540D2|nr:hypothetical protein [Leisingera caerulea]